MSYFDVSTCPDCRPGRLCDQHTGVMKDGGTIRVPMMMMDSVQRALHGRVHGAAPAIPDDVRAQARADHEKWKTQQQDAATGLDPHYREVLDAKGRQGAAQLKEFADNAARVQAHVDHYAEQDAARAAAIRANPREAAYQAVCDGLDYFSRQRG